MKWVESASINDALPLLFIVVRIAYRVCLYEAGGVGRRRLNSNPA